MMIYDDDDVFYRITYRYSYCISELYQSIGTQTRAPVLYANYDNVWYDDYGTVLIQEP